MTSRLLKKLSKASTGSERHFRVASPHSYLHNYAYHRASCSDDDGLQNSNNSTLQSVHSGLVFTGGGHFLLQQRSMLDGIEDHQMRHEMIGCGEMHTRAASCRLFRQGQFQ